MTMSFRHKIVYSNREICLYFPKIDIINSCFRFQNIYLVEKHKAKMLKTETDMRSKIYKNYSINSITSYRVFL